MNKKFLKAAHTQMWHMRIFFIRNCRKIDDWYFYCDKIKIFYRISAVFIMVLFCFLSYCLGAISAHTKINDMLTREQERLEEQIRESELIEKRKKEYFDSYRKRQIENGERPSDDFETWFFH